MKMQIAVLKVQVRLALPPALCLSFVPLVVLSILTRAALCLGMLTSVDNIKSFAFCCSGSSQWKARAGLEGRRKSKVGMLISQCPPCRWAVSQQRPRLLSHGPFTALLGFWWCLPPLTLPNVVLGASLSLLLPALGYSTVSCWFLCLCLCR